MSSDQTSAPEEFISPINEYNSKLKAAAQIARSHKGLVLAGQMLNQLIVMAFSQGKYLILLPSHTYFYNSMVKRQADILKAIQLVAPEIIGISIIKEEDLGK